MDTNYTDYCKTEHLIHQKLFSQRVNLKKKTKTKKQLVDRPTMMVEGSLDSYKSSTLKSESTTNIVIQIQIDNV